MKFVAVLVLMLTVGCAKAPPDLTPEASLAFKGTQAVKALDVLRDTAIAAHAQDPPLLSEDSTRKVVQYHQSAIKMMQAAPLGWAPAAKQALDELLNNLTEKDKALLTPYVVLLKTVIAEVTR